MSEKIIKDLPDYVGEYIKRYRENYNERNNEPHVEITAPKINNIDIDYNSLYKIPELEGVESGTTIMDLIRQKPSVITLLPEQSKEHCLEAVRVDSNAIKYITNPDEELWNEIANLLANKALERMNLLNNK